MTFRWFGADDPIPLSHIRQIPAVSGVVSALYDVPVGDVWPKTKIQQLADTIDAAGLELAVIESIPVHEDIKLGRAAIDDPKNLRPTRPIAQSGVVDIAGRQLDLRVAPFAATEADLWIYDAATRTVIAGDLVVAEVPFFDSGCPEGWRAALGEIAATPFERLLPGHGEPMTRDAFTRWRAAFDALLDCAASSAEVATCVSGWRTGAAAFIPAGDEARIDEYTTYYLTEILRSPAAHERFCHPLRAE